MRADRRTLLAALAGAPLAPWPVRAAAPEPAKYGVKTIAPVFIETSQRLRLAGRLWIPDGKPLERFPVVFEYIPYRTHDSYRPIDDHWGAQLAARGIAFARVDIRGSGNSEGILADEYLASEQTDGAEVIAWLAAQPWCNGKVGMRGLSWGGFSTLQVAALAPPALKAIMPMCATDMRFWNDAHYVGGSPGLTNLKWAAGFEMVMAAPPDPAVVGAHWREMWMARLKATPSIAARWLRHQTNDAYWRHGSVGVDPGAIRCPVYLVDGWSDSYAESAVRLMGSITAPKKALFGPWGHIYPDFGSPGPGLDWASEELRWWGHWLEDRDTGIMEEPAFRFYMPTKTAAQTDNKELPGRWIAEPTWPPNDVADLILRPSRTGALAEAEPFPGAARVKAGKIVGLTKPEWIPYAISELPKDQTPDDARSLVFDHAPLTKPMEVLGTPVLRIALRSAHAHGTLSARLCEVTPDGRSWVVSWAVRNLAFRGEPLDPPMPLEPHKLYEVTVPMTPLAKQIAPGSKVRLALSDGLWPLVWPSQDPADFEIDLERTSLTVPVRSVPAAEAPMPIASTHLAFGRGEPSLDIEEHPDGRVTVKGAWPRSHSTVGGVGTQLSGSGPDMDLEIITGAPESCRWTVNQTSAFKRDDWDCTLGVEITMTSTREEFIIEEALVAHEKGVEVFRTRRKERCPRDT